jgi:hypothetical protein
LFGAFLNAQGNVSRIVIADEFVDGLCLGTRIAIKVLQKQF